jgi:poly-gamma-glutamate synthesis protein (capsule biosynthesis protein)
VAVTHVLSPTARTSRAQLLGWASGVVDGPELVTADGGAAVRAILGLDALGANTLYLEDWAAAKEYVATHPGAWAILPWEVVDARVQAMPVDGAWPDPRRPWSNPLMRRLWLVEEAPLPSGVADALAEALRYVAAPTAELVAVGDIMLARLVGERISWWGARYPFEGEGIQPLLSNADIALGNLECAISERGERQDKGYTFRASPVITQGLTYAGFDVLSLANNHSGDFGDIALTDTLNTLADIGIATVGAGETITAAHHLRVVESNGLRVGFLAYNEIGPSWFAASETSPGSALIDLERMRAAVADARQEADVVVVSCHWGIEYTPYPTAYQREVAQALAEAGADLVIGHHPHVMQGLGYYPDTLVAFSLGNFIFDQGLSEQTEEGLILRALLDASGVKTVEWLRHAVTRSQPALVSPEQSLPMLERIFRVTREQGLLP